MIATMMMRLSFRFLLYLSFNLLRFEDRLGIKDLQSSDNSLSLDPNLEGISHNPTLNEKKSKSSMNIINSCLQHIISVLRVTHAPLFWSGTSFEEIGQGRFNKNKKEREDSGKDDNKMKTLS